MKTLLTLTATILLVFAGLTIDANSTYRTVSITCRDAATHEGISGVQTSALKSGTTIATGITDHSGISLLSVPANQSYTFRASLDGQQQESESIYVTYSSSTLMIDDFLFE